MGLTFRYLIITIFFLSILSSCYREFNINPPACTNCVRPVVLCFISPNNPIRAYASVTAPFTGAHSNNDNNFEGSLFLSDSTGNSVELTRSEENQRSFSYRGNNFEIKSGMLYTLKVITINGIISTAHTRVPKTSDTLVSITIIGISEDEYGENQYFTKLKWEKNTNFYNIIGFKETFSSSDFESKMYFDFNVNPIVSNNNMSEIIFSQFWRYKTHVTLFTINNNFYEYLQSYLLYQNFNSIGFVEGGFLDVFKGILPEYSNFNNSLGVFGAYVTDTISIVNPYPSPF